MVDPPSQPRRAIVFGSRAFASSSALHIFRFAGSGQANQHATRRAKGRYLACENFVETIIVAGGSQNAPPSPARQIAGYARRSLAKRTTSSVSKMCRVSRAAVISAYKQFLSHTQTLLDQIGSLEDPELRGSKVSAVFPSSITHRYGE